MSPLESIVLQSRKCFPSWPVLRTSVLLPMSGFVELENGLHSAFGSSMDATSEPIQEALRH